MENPNIEYLGPEDEGLVLRYDERESEVQLTPLQAPERDRALVRRSLWMMPLQDAQELATATGLSQDRVYRVLKNLRRHGLVTRASLGRAGGVRHRWWLTTQGVLRTADELGLPTPWQVTETGLRWLIRRLPAVEAFYGIAPHLFSHPDVLTPHEIYLTPDPDESPTGFHSDTKLVEFQWMQDGEIQAVAHYEHGAWLPLIWVGSMVSETVIKRKAESAKKQLAGGLQPAGWVIVCDDGLAAHQASDAWSDPDALVLVAHGRASRRMRPSAFSLRSLRETATPKDLGKPETIATWVDEDPEMLALNGARPYALFRFIADWPGATPQQLKIALGESYRAILRPLRRAGLVAGLDGGFYLGRAGILAVAHMDRISWQSVQSRLGAYLKPDGVYRRSQQRHNRSIVDVVLTLYRRDAIPYGGWRALHNIPGVTQVVPDAVVLRTRDDGPKFALFIEVEFTARTPAQIEAKLEPYRLAQQNTGDRIPCLFLVEDEHVRQRYASAGQDLINVLTLQQFLTGNLD